MQNPKDEEYVAEKVGSLYYDVSSLLKFQAVDKFGNIIHHLEDERYSVVIDFSNDRFLYFLEWTMKSGTIFATFLPKLIGERQMVVRLVDNRFKIRKLDLTCTHQMLINIIYPPCSPFLTLEVLHNDLGKCTAGEFIFDVKPYDIFGNAILHDSKEMCVVIDQAPAKTATKKEEVPVRRTITSKSFAVPICLKIAGHRTVKVAMSSGSRSSSKWFYVEVLPSVPHHLNDVRFTTPGAVDESFSADSTVIYRNQWSFLEAMLIDCYDNVIQKLSMDYNISLKFFPIEGKMPKMEDKQVAFRNGRLQAKVKLYKPGKYQVLITLTNISNQDQVYRLQHTPMQVEDAPLFLAGSKFHYGDTGVAGKEIQVEIYPVDVFGCPLPADTITNHELGGAILEVNKKETVEIQPIKKEGKIVICISVVLTKAGRRQVIIFVKDGKSKMTRKYVNIDIVPSSPKYLRIVEVCCDQNPKDEEHEPQEMNTLYYGVSSLLKFQVFDTYGNKIKQLEDERCYDVMTELSNADHLCSCEWEMRSGTIFATFFPKLIGERQMVVRLVDNRLKMRDEDLTCTHQMPINIIYPPCSPSITLQFLDDNLGKRTASEEIYFQIKPYDIFGNAVPNDSKEMCDITIQTRSPKTAIKKERKTVRKTITAQNCAVPVCLKVAGHRRMKVSVNSGLRSSSKDVDVEVLHSIPHHLNDVRFTTSGVVDESFSADSTVMYRNQWSFLEAVLVDSYNNVVQELTNDYNISLKLSCDEGEMTEMEYKQVQFRNGRFEVEVKIDKPGKHEVSITLTYKSNKDQVYRLEHVPVQVHDAPLFLAGSKFYYGDTGVAGNEIQVEIYPVDVFGCSLPVDTTTNYKFGGVILEVNKTKETMRFKIIKNKTNITICVSFVLTKAGSRQVIIFDKDDKSKMKRLHVNVDIVPSSPKYLRSVEICCDQIPEDEEHESQEKNTLYCGVRSLLKFQVFDAYGNRIQQLEDERCFDVMTELSNADHLHSCQWEMRSGTIFATFFPKLIGERQMVVRLVDNRLKMRDEDLTCTHQMPINIIYPPCSPSITLQFLDNLGKRTASEEIYFQVKPYDIFGNAVPNDSKEMCDITIQTRSPKTAIKKERKTVRKTITAQNCAVPVCLKVAGHRRMKVSVNSGLRSSSKDVDVEVLHSIPHHLNDVRFTTPGVVDESFSADSTVMYRNQWSFLEAVLVDSYNNVVQELTNDYNISLKLSCDEGEMTEMEYKQVQFRNGRFEVGVKIDKPGKHEVSITLTHKSNKDQVYRLEHVPVQVHDAPLFLAGSKFYYGDTGVAGKEIQVEIHPVDVFGCPLPVDTTTNYKFGGVILEINKSRETMKFKIIKNKANIMICVSFVLTKAGSRQVIIFDKDDKSKIKRMHANVDIIPSSPKYLRIVEVCCDQNPRDKEHEPQEMNTLYCGVSSLLKFQVFDTYGNRIQQLEDEQCYDIMTEFSNTDHLCSCEWEMRSGTIFATFFPNLIGERQMVVRLVDNRLKMRDEDPTCTHQMPINIIYPPCSPSITLQFLHDNLGQRTASEEIYFQIKPYDIFGNAVPNDSKEMCDVTLQAISPKTRTTEEGITVRKTITAQNCAVPVCLKVAGHRRMKVSVNSGLRSSSKDVDVEVLHSIPHHLNDVRFTTPGVVDESFSADSTVMYRNQWSFLEAVLVDCYDNVVQELSNECSISLKLFGNEGEMTKMEYKEVAFRNGRLQAKMKIDKPGKHKLLITLTHKSTQAQVYRLQHVPMQVHDAPLFLAGSKLHYGDTGVAGKEVQVGIHPVDVFGCPLPADTTTDFDLAGVTLKVNENKESMRFKIMKNEANVIICVSVILTKAGSRQVIVFDKGDKSKMKRLYVNVNIVPSSPKYLRKVEVCCDQNSKDEEHEPQEMTTLYYGVRSLLKFQVFDEYGNRIQQLEDERCFDVITVLSDADHLYSCEWKMRSGTIFATFFPKLTGERQMVVRLVDNRLKMKDEDRTCTHQMPINIIYPPCSPSITLQFLDLGKVTASEEIYFQIKPYDIFGNAVPNDSKEMCDITIQARSPKTATKKERKTVRKTITAQNCAVPVCLKVAGHRRMKVSVNSGLRSSSKDVDVEVLHSIPQHLNDVRFTTPGVVDESFSADSTVMYRNQWSFLEAVLTDCYNNVVQELTNDYNISLKLSGDEGKMTEMEYKQVQFWNGRFEVEVKIDKPGKHEVLITLTHKSNQDQVYRLEHVPVQVHDAPLFLAGSKFHYGDTGVAGKEIQLKIHPVDVFGCPLAADTTTNYKFGGVILEVNKTKETIKLRMIKDETNIVICVSVVLTKAGSRQVIVFEKDGKSKMKRMHANIDIIPSSPKYLRNVEVCCDQNPKDEEHEPQEKNTLYYGVRSLLKFQVFDTYGNRIQQLEDEHCYDVRTELSNADQLYSCEWEMRSGTIFATFFPKLIGERQVIVSLVDSRLKMRDEDPTCTHQMPINIIYPPCSPSITLQFLHDNLGKRTASEEIYFQIKPYDIFGNAVPNDSKEMCDVTLQAISPKTRTTEEGITVRRIITPESFAVPVCLKVAGHTRMKMSVKSGSRSSSRDIDVKVLPSIPHHLNDVKFTTTGAVDKSFSADSTVMYRNQWSFLEAVLFDCYSNAVQELSNDYNISLKLSGDERKMTEMEYEDVEFRNGRLKAKIKISKTGKHKLFLTLTCRSNKDQVYFLKDVPIEVEDAPLSLEKTEFVYGNTVAGKKMQVEIHPFDVFGCSLPADTKTDYELLLSGYISEVNENKETMKFGIVKNDSNIVIRGTIVLKKAGSRKVVFGKDDQSKVMSIDVCPDLTNLHWKLTAENEIASQRENLVLSVCLLDRFNNEVRTDSLGYIPELVKTDGPDGLQCTGRSTEDYKVTFQCQFTITGKYDLCLADCENGNSLDGTSVSITVQDAPFDCSRSSIRWTPEYDDIPDQPVFPEDESFRCRLELLDSVGHKYGKIVAKDCVKVKYNNTEVKNIKVSSRSNEIGCFDIVVPLKNLVGDDPCPEFWCFVDGRKIEKPLILPTFKAFQIYDDDRNCVIHDSSLEIFCYGVKPSDIIGSDHCNLNNIKRVCRLDDDPKIRDCFGNSRPIRPEDNSDNDDDVDDEICTIIELPFEGIVRETWEDGTIICSEEKIDNKIHEFRKILLRLLRALYYRQEAFELDNDREEWKEQASENYRKIKRGESIDKKIPHLCSQIKEKCAALMRRYHDAACEEFFQFYNTDRDQSEIDLHGLLVADEKKLRDYERQLRSRDRLSSTEVSRKIDEEREHGNEAKRFVYLGQLMCTKIF